jgi:hypothetical protein
VCGMAVPQKQYEPHFGNGARYACSCFSILNPPCLTISGMFLVTWQPSNALDYFDATDFPGRSMAW